MPFEGEALSTASFGSADDWPNTPQDCTASAIAAERMIVKMRFMIFRFLSKRHLDENGPRLSHTVTTKNLNNSP